MRAPAFLGRLWRTRALLWGLLVAAIALLSLCGPWVVAHDPMAMDSTSQLLPPGRHHWLGTDPFGRDILSRLVWGGRRTLGVAGAAVLITVGAGLLLGLLSGYFGGAVDEAIMRVVDVMLAFPGLLLILGLVAVLGAGSKALAVAVGITGVPAFSRLVRSAAMSAREELYVLAALAVGCRRRRVITRHLLPNIVGPVVAFATVQFGWAILNASATSFLGLGESPSVPEWGSMLNLGRGYLRAAPWVSGAPGLAITLAVLSVNMLGDELRRLFDPALRWQGA